MNIAISDPHYQQKLDVINILTTIADPELAINIIDLGLVYEIGINDAPQITITMTLSSPSCPVGGIIKNNVALAVKEHFPGHNVVVDLVFEPRWSLEMITDAGKAELGW